MNTAKHIGITLTVAVAVVAAVLWVGAYTCSRLEQPHRFYHRHSQAVAAGEVLRGWLPAWVPPQARDIHIQGELDNNRRWIRFALDGEDARKLRSVLSSIPDSEVEQVVPRRSPAYGDWWFEGLVQVQPANDDALSADIFRGEVRGGQLFVAFDRVSPTVYVWGN
jgi:hypothetical protein